MNQQMSVSLRALLSKATNNTKDPTPGYVYHELVEHCKSFPHTTQPIITYLLKKLDKDPVVRLKTIKTLKFFCENGPHEFTRSLSYHADTIKLCLNLNDADEYHRPLISQEIETLLQILYSGSYKTPMFNNNSNNFTNFGNAYNSSYQPQPILSSQSNTVNFDPKGYGNTNFTNNKKILTQSPAEQAFTYIHQLANKYVPPKIMGHVERFGSIVVEKARVATSGLNTTFNTYQPSPIRMPATSFNAPIVKVKDNKESFEKEEAVFLEAMKTGGVMVAPSAQVIELMSKKASKLDPRGIAAAVIKCLSMPDIKNGKSYARALCLLEGALRSEYLSNEQRQNLSDYMIEHGLECLYRCKVSPPLRKVSERVLRILKLQGTDDVLDTDILESNDKTDQNDSLITLSNPSDGVNKDLLDISFNSPNRKANDLDFLNDKIKSLSVNTNNKTVGGGGLELLDFGTTSNDLLTNNSLNDASSVYNNSSDGNKNESGRNGLLEDISNNDLFSFIDKEIGINK